jgi:peptide/nickel transport system ATP-binding protein
VEIGPAREVFGTPRHPYTQALLASALTVTPGAGVPDNRMGASFPNPLGIPPGCPFHPRCPAAMAVCSRVSPAVTHIGGARVRCHLYTAESADRTEAHTATPA